MEHKRLTLFAGHYGSGKTNICIDKIIFTACRNYSGKTLYTTFSRGLLIDTKLKVEEILENVVSDTGSASGGYLSVTIEGELP